MTTTYNGTNIGLEYDAEAGTWGFKNIEQNFIDTNTFSTADPSFEYAPVPPANDTEPEQDPCPPGYVYDETLKQCVPDPNYQNPFIREQPQGGSDDDFSDTNKIPSNATKENWIENANTIIPPGQEGAGKTGYENYIDNLKERGFTKVVDGKLVFKKDNLGNEIGSAMLTRFGMGDEPEAKVNKIIQDLQRMGGINAQITAGDIDPETGEPSIDFASELELADAPGTFATMGGNFTGFITPAGNAFPTWETYINSIMQPFTSTSSQIKNTTTVSAGDRLDAENRKKEAEALAAEIKAEKEAVNLEIKKNEKDEKQNFQPGEDTKREQQKKEDYKNMIKQEYGLSDDFADKSYVRNQAGQISYRPESFKKDTERTPSGKSYTQSKIEQAAKTGRYSGF